MPADIAAQVDWDKGAVRLKPTLLNSNDSITISVLTEGGNPKFTLRARIIGLPTVALTYPEKSKLSTPLKLGMLLAGFLIAIPVMIAYRRFDLPATKGTVIHRGTLISLILVGQGVSISLMAAPMVFWGIESFWVMLMGSFVLLATAGLIAAKLDIAKDSAPTKQNTPAG
jgi:hypothetical protein